MKLGLQSEAIWAILVVAAFAQPASAVQSSGVASDPTLLGLPPGTLPSGPGNSAAATNDGDANCFGDFLSASAPASAGHVGGPGITEGISTLMTVGTLPTLDPDFECSEDVGP